MFIIIFDFQHRMHRVGKHFDVEWRSNWLLKPHMHTFIIDTTPWHILEIQYTDHRSHRNYTIIYTMTYTQWFGFDLTVELSRINRAESSTTSDRENKSVRLKNGICSELCKCGGHLFKYRLVMYTFIYAGLCVTYQKIENLQSFVTLILKFK